MPDRARQEVQIAARMYEMQETAKLVFGDQYADRVEAWKQAIVVVEAKLNCGVLQAALYMANPDAGHGVSLSEFDVLLIVAAAVELAESPEVRREAANA